MDYEDYVPESEYYDPEADLFSDVVTADSWNESEWDPYCDWVYEGEYTDTYDNYYN